MANLTLTIEDQTLRAARIRALEQGTSVNALVREYLIEYAGGQTAGKAVRALLARAARSEAASGVQGRSWTRDDVYDRVRRR